MLYMWFAIISSAMVSTVMRIGEKRIRNNMAMFVTNYCVCTLLSRLFMGNRPLFISETGIGLAVGFGMFSGVLYLVNFVLLQNSIRKNGIVLSATFMKLGVLIPTLMAIVVFREQPKALQLIGMLLSLLAIVLIHFEKEDMGSATKKWLLLVILFCSGFTDSTANIFNMFGNAELKDYYLIYTFTAAGICALLMWLKEKQNFSWWDALFGICIGIPNYFSARFLLMSLQSLPAVIVYPVYSVATIVVIAVIGVLIFHEKLSAKKVWALGMILVALALLNVA